MIPVPAMPLVESYQLWPGSPVLLADDGGARYGIGWRRWPDKKGGPGFVVARLGALGPVKMLERFPLTEDGWARAWRALAGQPPESLAGQPPESLAGQPPESLVGELGKLASMLDNGLLTRAEFDQLKARLISGS